MRLVASAVILLVCCAATAAAGPHTFRGRRLDDALQVLQSDGLPIVFSSEIVTPRMRVTAEPRAANPRLLLDEILAPNGLATQPGPGGVILIVRARATPSTPVAEPGTHRRPAVSEATGPSARPGSYSDHVTVTPKSAAPVSVGTSEATLDRSALEESGGPLDADGLAAVHAMPGVSAIDDFRSDLSVRGSPYRQIGIVVDGVATPWLQHRVSGRGDLGSVSMFGSDSLDSVTLQAGAYPRVYDDTLGAQLALNLREGSRNSTRLTGTLGGMTTALAAEGPIGTGARGSWIAGVRDSYRSWPPGQPTKNSGFGFADLHLKLVYDLSPTQQVSVTGLGGQSTLDTVDEPQGGALATGTEGAGLLNIGWRSVLASGAVVRQRIFVIGQNLSAASSGGAVVGGGSNRDLGYRGDVQQRMLSGVFQAGVELSHLSGRRDIEPSGSAVVPYSLRDAWMTHAAYFDFARTFHGGLSFEAGVRASDSTLVQQRALAPWVLGAWRLAPGWTINVSAGASRQFADLDVIVGSTGAPALRPERATHVDVGIEQRLSTGIRWQATLFNRLEQDVLRGPDPVTPVPAAGLGGLGLPSYQNALSGAARGLEFVVTPEQQRRVSGWLSYVYAVERQRDVNTHETFWSDLDRRHSVNVAGMFRMGTRTSASLVFRGASGVPIPGYFDLRNGSLIAGNRLNTVRLPAYVRLDGRLQRRVFSSAHQVTLFAEIINALNRGNEGPSIGVVEPATGAATGFSRPLVARQVSVGITIALSR